MNAGFHVILRRPGIAQCECSVDYWFDLAAVEEDFGFEAEALAIAGLVAGLLDGGEGGLALRRRTEDDGDDALLAG